MKNDDKSFRITLAMTVILLLTWISILGFAGWVTVKLMDHFGVI